MKKDNMTFELMAIKIGLKDEEEIKEFARMMQYEGMTASEALRLIIEGKYEEKV